VKSVGYLKRRLGLVALSLFRRLGLVGDTVLVGFIFTLELALVCGPFLGFFGPPNITLSGHLKVN
jgi:hypothetical protein